MLATVTHIVLALVALWLISGTAVNFSKHPHWYIRLWDFPRVFVALLATAVAVPYAILFHARWWDWLLLVGLALVVARQLYMIYPYTPIGRERVKRSDRPAGDDSLRLMISNVLMENEKHDLWLEVVRA